jgi:hypothetical protein
MTRLVRDLRLDDDVIAPGPQGASSAHEPTDASSVERSSEGSIFVLVLDEPRPGGGTTGTKLDARTVFTCTCGILGFSVCAILASFHCESVLSLLVCFSSWPRSPSEETYAGKKRFTLSIWIVNNDTVHESFQVHEASACLSGQSGGGLLGTIAAGERFPGKFWSPS